VTTGTFLKADVPTKKCDVHVPVTICTDSGMRSNAYCPADKIVTISLLDVDRTGKVSMSDDAYLYSEIVAVTDDTDATAYNTYCTHHTSTLIVVPDDWFNDQWGWPGMDDGYGGNLGGTVIEVPEQNDEILPDDSLVDMPIG